MEFTKSSSCVLNAKGDSKEHATMELVSASLVKIGFVLPHVPRGHKDNIKTNSINNDSHSSIGLSIPNSSNMFCLCLSSDHF